MIIVSGEPRSGTSLMMQTLKHLGIDVVGDKFWEKGSQSKRDLNPDGFYEVKKVVVGGINKDNAKLYQNKAVKVITVGILPDANNSSSLEYCERLIYCTRSPAEIAMSQTKLEQAITVSVNKGYKWDNRRPKPDLERYIVSVASFLKMYFGLDASAKAKISFVDYSDMISSPLSTVKRVCAIVNANPELVSNAVSNINQNLYRTKDITISSPDVDLAMSLYACLRKLDETYFQSIKAVVQQFCQKKSEDIKRWLDEETWLDVNIALANSLETNPVLKQKMLASAQKKVASGATPLSCSYRKDSEKFYTVSRPQPLGDLVRPMILCGEKQRNVTREECKMCWQTKKFGL